MPDPSPDLRELAEAVRDLSSRVARIEKALSNGARPTKLKRSPPPTDLEARIGSQWLNRIGIVAVLVGISYFLKYAFENNYVGPAARIALGLSAGLALMIWSEWFRKQYPVFSFSLKAVGLGTLYLSLWAAFDLYQLIGTATAFIAMVIVTLATIILAIRQDAEILGTFALVGGFATPLLISVRQETPLFVYIALLDFATFALVVYRPWRRLLLLSIIGTAIVYFAWYARYYRSELELTLAFATLFFAVFAFAPVAQANFHADFPWRSLMPFVAALLNAGFYLPEADLVLHSDSAKATVAFAMAAAFLLLARQLEGRAPTLARLHGALALSFISLGIAMRFEAHWITIGWFVEFLVVLAIGFWRDSAFLRWGAIALIVATTIKVFAYDVWRLDRGYRIVVFIGLGVLCLGISFLYQNDLLRISGTRQHD